MKENEIEGSGSSYYKNMGAERYREKINTPAKSSEYFNLFNKPIIERAKEKFGSNITMLDIACGPADELDFIKNDPNIKIIATDISPDILSSVKEKLGNDALIFANDSSLSAIKDNVAEVGMLVNALIYVPDKMLKTMYDALKQGGECSVNFRVFGNEHNNAFYNYYREHQGKIIDQELNILVPGGKKRFFVKVLDYTECVNDDGSPDEAIRHLGQQTYFQSTEDIKELIKLIGFEEVEHSQFQFSSPVNPKNEIDVYILRKP